MTNYELGEVLHKHGMWLRCENGGDLSGADLNWKDLGCADLRNAKLYSANLNHANLSGADLRSTLLGGADLRNANLRGANVRYANLCYANLSNANLRNANLYGANLTGADLSGADLYGANLRSTLLRDANLSGVNGCYQMCPSEGEFIAYKKCIIYGTDNATCIVKLLIPADARRSSATTEKCRADKAIVLEIQDLDGNKIECNAYSFYAYGRGQDFEYKVGETVTPKEPFCEDRWQECGSGIHFFIDRKAAVEYC